MIKTTLCALLFVAVFSAYTANAADSPVDGRWIWSSDVEGVDVDFELHLVSEKDKVTGTLKAPKMDLNAKVQDGGIDDGNVWFDIEFERGGAQIKAAFSGEFDASAIEGDIEVSLDGAEEADIEWRAERETRPQDVVGVWDFVLEAPDGNTYRPEFAVKLDGDKLKGTMTAEGEEMPVEKLALKKNRLTFAYTIPYNGSDLELAYDCFPTGNKLSATIEYNVDGDSGDFTGSAKRRVLDARQSALVGSWKCETTGPDGVTRYPILSLQNSGGKLTGTLKSDELDIEIKEVSMDGDYISFPFSNDHDGVTVNLVWKCKASGDKLIGEIDYEFEDQSGTIDVTGKRTSD